MALENVYQTPKAVLELKQKPYIASPLTWQGRIGRIEYYLFVLFALFISSSFAFILITFVNLPNQLRPWLGLITATAWIMILSKRRFNDFNHRGRLAALIFIPVINLLLLLVLLFIPGDKSSNNYGDPSRITGQKKFYFYISLMFVVIYILNFFAL